MANLLVRHVESDLHRFRNPLPSHDPRELVLTPRIGAKFKVYSGRYRKIPCATEQGMFSREQGILNRRTANVLAQSGNRLCLEERSEILQ
jgi:hypothetical protein